MSPDLIDAALRSLDPADRDVVVPPAPRYDTPPVRRRPRRRVALSAAAVAAVAAGVVALPSLTGGEAAFASWRPNAAALQGDARAAAAADCLDGMGHAGVRGWREFAGIRPVIAEARGDWRMVVLANAAGYSGDCIGRPDLKEFGGGFNRPTDFTRPTPRQLVPVSLGTATLTEGDISAAIGLAGREVVGVRYDSASHGPVEATVTDGWFALWVPGDDMEDQAPDDVPLRVTYRDGTSAAVTLGFV